MFETKFRIEPRARDLVDDEIIQKLGQNSLFLISGNPLICYEPELYYDQNTHISDMPFKPYVLSVINIPILGHNHHSEKYLGIYPILGGINPDTSVEFIFGIRPCLDFKILDI